MHIAGGSFLQRLPIRMFVCKINFLIQLEERLSANSTLESNGDDTWYFILTIEATKLWNYSL